MSSPRPAATALDAEVLLSHGAWLAALARALVAREDEVDDVVQQTYVRALEQPPRHAANVKGWLGTVARNVVGMRRRSESARVAREAAVPRPAPVETPHEAVERAELRRMVVESVLALDEPTRSAVILRFFEERDVPDIARLTAANEETVRTRIRRGVERVRKELERKVDAGTGDAAREGVAARALLFVRLREIAASGGGGGATGSAAASRTLARAGRSQATALPARVVGFGAAAAVVLVAVGGWAWWRVASSEKEKDAEKGAGVVAEVADASRSRATDATPVVLPERQQLEPVDTAPPPPTPTPIAVSATTTDRGTLRGIVTGLDGEPVADAHVWAIASPSHQPPFLFAEFPRLALAQADSDPTKPPLHPWVAQRSGADGRFEFQALSLLPGWAIGAYDPKSGAVLSELVELDRLHLERTVDVQLVRGVRVKGRVTDEAGTPIAGARLAFDTTGGGKSWRINAVSAAFGPRIGEFEFDYQCGETFQISCGAATFVRTKRATMTLKPGATTATLPFKLVRKPGVLVRGAIVDPAGDPVVFAPLLEEALTSQEPALRATLAVVWAVAAGTKMPAGLMPTMSAPGVTEGRIDFAKSAYEVVVPEGFTGSLELRVLNWSLGSAELDDLQAPPEIECNPERVPEGVRATTFTARFVDATTKAPIDLRSEASPPELFLQGIAAPRVLSGCDLERGVVEYRCLPEATRIDAKLRGYAHMRLPVVIPKVPAREPTTFELLPATSTLRGTALRADGKPLATTKVALFRRTTEGWSDVTGSFRVTNLDGEFAFESLADGEHAVVVSGRPDEAPGVARFVASGATANVEVRSRWGRLVRFAILRGEGRSGEPKFTDVRILDRDGLQIEQYDNLDSDPVVSLDSSTVVLADGRYTVTVSSFKDGEGRVEFDAPREVVEIPLEIRGSK